MSIPSVEKMKPSVERRKIYSRYRRVSTLTFGTWLRQKRKDKGLTQLELAEMVGVSLPYISKLERDQRHNESNVPPKPTATVVDRIAKAVGVTVQEARDRAYGGTAAELPAAAELAGAEPLTRHRFIAELRSLGVEDFNPAKGWSKLTPQDMEEVLEMARRQARAAAKSAAETMVEQKVKGKD
jgi:transcriptional regulator with XRE-family HTH domain